jgi:uroporphyrin-III C-methyltransferase/precorrin-2 dehydrogenase/sirohydrochlorin ferrochelatase
LSELGRAITETGIKGPAIIFVGLDWASAGLALPDKIKVYEPVRVGAAGQMEGAAAAPAPQEENEAPQVVDFAR